MQHLKDIEILEYVNGTLDEDRRQAVFAHLDGCTSCRRREAELAHTWTRLGNWHVDISGLDLTSRVLQSVEELTSCPAACFHWRPWLVGILRTAAVLLLAVWIGSATGSWAAKQSHPVLATQPDDRIVSGSLFAPCLEPRSATGLMELVMDDGTE